MLNKVLRIRRQSHTDKIALWSSIAPIHDPASALCACLVGNMIAAVGDTMQRTQIDNIVGLMQCWMAVPSISTRVFTIRTAETVQVSDGDKMEQFRPYGFHR